MVLKIYALTVVEQFMGQVVRESGLGIFKGADASCCDIYHVLSVKFAA